MGVINDIIFHFWVNYPFNISQCDLGTNTSFHSSNVTFNLISYLIIIFSHFKVNFINYTLLFFTLRQNIPSTEI